MSVKCSYVKMWPLVFKSTLKHLHLKVETVETEHTGGLTLQIILKEPIYYIIVLLWGLKGWKWSVEECLIHIKYHTALTANFSWTWARRLYTNGFHPDFPVLLYDGKTWLNYNCIIIIEGTERTLFFCPIDDVIRRKLNDFCPFFIRFIILN